MLCCCYCLFDFPGLNLYNPYSLSCATTEVSVSLAQQSANDWTEVSLNDLNHNILCQEDQSVFWDVPSMFQNTVYMLIILLNVLLMGFPCYHYSLAHREYKLSISLHFLFVQNCKVIQRWLIRVFHMFLLHEHSPPHAYGLIISRNMLELFKDPCECLIPPFFLLRFFSQLLFSPKSYGLLRHLYCK